MARKRPVHKKAPRSDLSKKGQYDRSVIRLKDHSTYHFTKGRRKETKYERLQRLGAV